MKSQASLVFLQLFFSLVQTIHKLPLYLGIGYDVFQGNPLASLDPGFRGLSPFKITYVLQQTTEDEKYLIPDASYSLKQSTCYFDSDYKTYESYSYLQNEKYVAQSGGASFSMKLDIGVDDIFSSSQGFSLAFSANSEMSMLSKLTSWGNVTTFTKSAKCSVYTLEIDLPRLELSSQFVNDLKYAISQRNTNQSINSVVYDKYGTHQVKQAIYGAEMSIRQSYSKSDLNTLKQQSSTFNMAFSYQMDASFKASGLFGGSASLSLNYAFNDTEKKLAIQNFSKILQQQSLSSKGSNPTRESTLDWYNEVIENPAVTDVKYTLLIGTLAQFNLTQYGLNYTQTLTLLSQALSYRVQYFGVIQGTAKPYEKLLRSTFIYQNVTCSMYLTPHGIDYTDLKINSSQQLYQITLYYSEEPGNCEPTYQYLAGWQSVYRDSDGNLYQMPAMGKFNPVKVYNSWSITLSTNEFVTKIVINYKSDWLGRIKFATNQGNVYQSPVQPYPGCGMVDQTYNFNNTHPFLGTNIGYYYANQQPRVTLIQFLGAVMN